VSQSAELLFCLFFVQDIRVSPSHLSPIVGWILG
jgi:hypothetical protein